MKILYGASELNGSNIRLSHFLLHTTHEVRVAAHYKNHHYLKKIHWNLDAFNNEPEKSELLEGKLKVNSKALNMMLDDLAIWLPDMIICDFEPITALIAWVLDIPLISASPMHLIDGVVWPDTKKTIFAKETALLKLFNHAERKLIISPFGMFDNLSNNLEWVMPYQDQIDTELTNIKNTVLSNNAIFTTGETEALTKAILTEKKICIADVQSDPESKLNGIFVEMLGLGLSIGEAQPSYTLKRLDTLFKNNYPYQITNTFKKLHELI